MASSSTPISSTPISSTPISSTVAAVAGVLSDVHATTRIWRGPRAKIWHVVRACPRRRESYRVFYSDVAVTQLSTMTLCPHCLAASPLPLRAGYLTGVVTRRAQILDQTAKLAEQGRWTVLQPELAEHRSVMADLGVFLDQLSADLDRVMAGDEAALDDDGAPLSRAGLSAVIARRDQLLRARRVLTDSLAAIEALAKDRAGGFRGKVSGRCAALLALGACTGELATVGGLLDEPVVTQMRYAWSAAAQDRDAPDRLSRAADALREILDEALSKGPRSVGHLPPLNACPPDVAPLDALTDAWEQALRAGVEDLLDAAAAHLVEIETAEHDVVVLTRGSLLTELPQMSRHRDVIEASVALPPVPGLADGFELVSMTSTMARYLGDLYTKLAVVPADRVSDPERLAELLTVTCTLALDSDMSLAECLDAAGALCDLSAGT